MGLSRHSSSAILSSPPHKLGKQFSFSVPKPGYVLSCSCSKRPKRWAWCGHAQPNWWQQVGLATSLHWSLAASKSWQNTTTSTQYTESWTHGNMPGKHAMFCQFLLKTKSVLLAAHSCLTRPWAYTYSISWQNWRVSPRTFILIHTLSEDSDVENQYDDIRYMASCALTMIKLHADAGYRNSLQLLFLWPGL